MLRLASRQFETLETLTFVFRNRWLNLVLVVMVRSSMMIEDAFQRVVAIHNADVEEIDRLAFDLPKPRKHSPRYNRLVSCRLISCARRNSALATLLFSTINATAPGRCRAAAQ